MIDKKNTTVTMTLEDYENLQGYVERYNRLISDIRSLVYIDYITPSEVVVVLKKQKLTDFVVPFAASDCELDGYPEGVTVIWK